MPRTEHVTVLARTLLSSRCSQISPVSFTFHNNARSCKIGTRDSRRGAFLAAQDRGRIYRFFSMAARSTTDDRQPAIFPGDVHLHLYDFRRRSPSLASPRDERQKKLRRAKSRVGSRFGGGEEGREEGNAEGNTTRPSDPRGALLYLCVY